MQFSRARLLACVIFGVIFLAACDNKAQLEIISTDISGAPFGKDFELQDHTGTVRTLSDFKDKVVVLFFGYTQCPEMCPTTMAELAETMERLGQDASQVQVLFVTLDPKNDSLDTLSQYVLAFDSRFIGLTGTEENIKSVAEEFKIYYQLQVSEVSEQTVDHSTGTYLFDKNGDIRLYVRYGSGEETFLHDIKALLKSS